MKSWNAQYCGQGQWALFSSETGEEWKNPNGDSLAFGSESDAVNYARAFHGRASPSAQDVYFMLDGHGLRYEVVEVFEGARVIRIEVHDQWDVLDG